MVEIYGQKGARRDWAWLYETYGPVSIVPGSAPAEWEVVEIREACGAASINVDFVGLDGVPADGVGVAWSWPDAPADRRAGFTDHAVKGKTDTNGHVGFAMGAGAWYEPGPHKAGPHSVWPWGATGPMVKGLGMLIGPEGPTGRCHLNVVYQALGDPQPQPDPQPDPDPGPDPVPQPDPTPGDLPAPVIPSPEEPEDRWLGLFWRLDRLYLLLYALVQDAELSLWLDRFGPLEGKAEGE